MAHQLRCSLWQRQPSLILLILRCVRYVLCAPWIFCCYSCSKSRAYCHGLVPVKHTSYRHLPGTGCSELGGTCYYSILLARIVLTLERVYGEIGFEEFTIFCGYMSLSSCCSTGLLCPLSCSTSYTLGLLALLNPNSSVPLPAPDRACPRSRLHLPLLHR